MTHRTQIFRQSTALFVAAGFALAMVGCSDDDDSGVSAQEQYCEAGAALRSSIDSLSNLDLVAEGTSGLQDAVDAVTDDVDQLRNTAGESAAPEVDALSESVDDLEDAVSGLSGDISADSASSLATAVANVSSSAKAVYATLSDC